MKNATKKIIPYFEQPFFETIYGEKNMKELHSKLNII